MRFEGALEKKNANVLELIRILSMVITFYAEMEPCMALKRLEEALNNLLAEEDNIAMISFWLEMKVYVMARRIAKGCKSAEE